MIIDTVTGKANLRIIDHLVEIIKSVHLNCFDNCYLLHPSVIILDEESEGFESHYDDQLGKSII